MDGVGPLVSSAAVHTLFYPWTYTKVLIQIGHEPVAPVNSTTIWGKKVLRYPNVFNYTKYIRQVDGFTGMYRGLGPRLISGMICSVVQNKITKKLKPKEKSQNDDLDDDVDQEEDGLLRFFKETGIEMVCRSTAVIVSHPFHVIMVRAVAQFVGRETAYNDSISAISEIYSKEGISGFFAGLVPRLLGEVASIWLTSSLSYFFITYLIPKENKELGHYAKAMCSLMTASLTYPFTVVSTNMCVNNCGLAAGKPPLMPVFNGWRDCWSQLRVQNGLKRGANMLNRYYLGPTIGRADGTLIPADPLFINY